MASFGMALVEVIPSPTFASSTSPAASNSTSTTAPPPPASILASFAANIDDLSPSSRMKRLPVPVIPVTQPSLPRTATAPRVSSFESEHALLDRWAFALADWVIPRWDHPIRELDGWRTVTGMHGGFVRDCSLSVFVLLGASEEMPFTVYRDLDVGNEETIEPAVSWMRDLRARRMLQSALSPPLPPPISPPPLV